MLYCPRCKESLNKSLECESPDCDFAESYLILSKKSDLDDVCNGLANTPGVFIDVARKNFHIEGATINLEGSRTYKDAEVARWIQSKFHLSAKAFGPNQLTDLLHLVRMGKTPIPRVGHKADYPLFNSSKQFHYTSEQVSRFCEGMYYSGEPMTPQQHGGIFDEWLDTFRFHRPIDRVLLRAWLLSLHYQFILGAKSYPVPIFTSPTGCGSGKTATAQHIAVIFGSGALQDSWSNRSDVFNIERKISGVSERFYLLDNLSTNGNQDFIASSGLAEFLTKKTYSVKKLYSSEGAISSPRQIMYFATANSPTMSLELLERILPIGISKPLKVKHSYGLDGWEGHWVKKKKLILEESMWIAQQNYDKGEVFPCGDYPLYERYPVWVDLATKIAGVSLEVMGMDSISSPLDGHLDYTFEICQAAQEGMTVEAVVASVKDKKNPSAKSLMSEKPNFNEHNLKSILKYWSRGYILEKGVVKCQNHQN